jgi:hypothetical protein
MPAWRVCPDCRRHVPPGVEQCRCGLLLESAVPSRRPRWLVTSLVVVGALGLALVIDQLSSPKAPEPSPVLSRAPAPLPAAPATLPSAPPPTPPPAPVAPRADPGWAAATMPSPLPIPVPQAPPTPQDDMDRLKEQGRQTLATRMSTLSGQAAQLAAYLQAYETRCRGDSFVHGSAQACLGLRGDMQRMKAGITQGLESAEEDARRSWVEPGLVRRMRESYGMDSGWDELSRAVGTQ